MVAALGSSAHFAGLKPQIYTPDGSLKGLEAVMPPWYK